MSVRASRIPVAAVMSASMLVGLAVAGSSGATSSEDTVAEASVATTSGAVVSSGVVTTEFVTLTDDSGTITVDVPSSWTDVDTAPLGGEFPQIEATPYRQAYYDTFDVPGVTYRAIHFTTDTESLVHNFAIPDGCAHEEVQPYDDGVFVGSHLIDSECGSFGTAEYHVIVANPANQAFTAVVVVQITGPHELPILERILDSFNVAAGAGPTTSTPSTSSTVAAPTTTTDAAGVFPPPTGEVPAGWTDLIDDTATIRISVPSTWTATRLVSPSDATVPWISATTDEALFLPPEGTPDTFGVPGVLYQASPFDPDTAARLEASSFHDVCTAGPLQTYDDTVFVGHIQTFTACNGTASSIVRVSANPADQAFTADLLIQLTGQPDDAETLNGLLLSFNRITPGIAPTTTVAAGAPSTTIAGRPSTTARPRPAATSRCSSKRSRTRPAWRSLPSRAPASKAAPHSSPQPTSTPPPPTCQACPPRCSSSCSTAGSTCSDFPAGDMNRASLHAARPPLRWTAQPRGQLFCDPLAR